MAINRDTIDHNTVAHLLEAGAVCGVDVIGQPGGWGVVVKYGMTERPLAARRGAVRVFRKFETLAGYLKGLGISEYRVDATGFTPTATAHARPDSAERMRLAHEAAAYNDWLNTKVSASLEGLAQGTNRRIEADEWDRLRAAKAARLTP